MTHETWYRKHRAKLERMVEDEDIKMATYAAWVASRRDIEARVRAVVPAAKARSILGGWYDSFDDHPADHEPAADILEESESE